MRLPEIKSLQVLRAIAAISIALVHIDTISFIYMNRDFSFSPPIFEDWGIDLFFVLSGYIIFYIHNKDFGDIKRLKEYLLKRIVRIYPIYWLVTLLIFPIFFIFKNIGSGYERDTDVIIKSLLLFPQTHSPILFLGWTLVHEIRFYIIFALLIALKRSWAIILLCIIIIPTLLIFVLNPQGLNFFITDYFFSFYNIEFLLGCLSVYITGLSSTRLQKLYAVSLFLLYLFFICFNSPLILKNRAIFLGIPFSLTITMLAIYELRYSLKVPKTLLYLGQASYSIYLTHYLFIAISAKLLIAWGFSKSVYLPFIMLFVLVVTVGGGCLFYSRIEKPIQTFLKTKLLSTFKT